MIDQHWNISIKNDSKPTSSHSQKPGAADTQRYCIVEISLSDLVVPKLQSQVGVHRIIYITLHNGSYSFLFMMKSSNGKREEEQWWKLAHTSFYLFLC